MEGALQQGAGYNNAFTYGILSGATEAAMEKLGGYAFGNATSLLGKATAGTKFGAWASKGLGKAITGAVSEGVEELGSDFADPVNKWITGVDTEIGANFRAAVKNIPRTFIMGATVGSIMQGGQVLGQNMSNKAAGRGGAKATRADSLLAYVSESAQNYGKNEALNKKTDKAILQGLTDVGVQMTQMSESERAKYRESLGEYKNAFNEDGSIKQDLVNADVNNEAISRKLKPISLTLKHAPISSNEQISEGASQAKAHIEKVLGSKANVVITSDSKETNAYFSPDENVFYINNNSATLNDADSAIKKASLQVSFHEMTHSAEGTRQYNEFVKELYRVAKDENAPDAIKKRVGSLFDRELGARQDYAEQTKGMSKAQARYTFDTEVTADLSGDLLADDYIVNKLAERNAPLLKKLISRFKGTIKKSATVDSESIKYLKKLVNRFEKALDNAQGGVKISQIGNDDEEREEKADSSQQSADSKVDDERKSKSSKRLTERDVAEYLKSGERQNKKRKEALEQGEKIILTSESEINTYINDAIDGKKGLITIAYGKVNERLAQDFQNNYDGKPMDIKNFFLEFVPSDIHHAYEQHIKAKEYGDIDLSREDFENIPKYIDEYSEMLYAKKYDSGNTKIALSVKKPNGRVLVISVVSKSHGSIAFKNMIGLSEEKYIFEYENVYKKRNSSNARGSESSNTSLRDETASIDSIPQNSEKDNTFDENNSKKVSNERKSVKRSYEPGGKSSKKITLGMSDAERTEILKDKKIQRIAEAQQFSQDVLEKIPEIHTWEDIDKYFGKQKRNLIQKIADEFKVFKNYENKDISLSFEFTNNNFRESYGKQKNKFVSFAKMFSVFDTVIENAVGIEVHKRPDYKPDPTLKNVYVLMSSFADGDYFIPVKLEIKEFNDKQNKLYVAIALDGIKKTEVSKQGTTEIGVAQGSRSVNISILDLIQKINPSNTNFTKYFPKNILTQAQKEILDSDTNNDERKSVKRSYEPGKESEFKETLHDKYDNAGQEKTSEKQKGKKKSQYTAKGTIKNLIKDVFETYVTVENIDDDFAFVSKEAGNDVVTDIWKKLNDSNAKYDKKKFASLMADKILENTILADSKIYDADKLLKGFMHRIDLSSVADQIGSDIKRKINARWALKEGQEAISINNIVQALNTKVGVQISAQDLLGAVTEINSLFIKYC